MTDLPYPQQPPREIRLSEAERADALAQLTYAYGEGRLDPEEYDRRCDALTRAATFGDVLPLFHDLPAVQLQQTHQHGREMELYSRQELSAARRNGQNMRLGLLGVGAVLSFAAGMLLSGTGAAVLGTVLPLVVIPTLFILLYVMKVGPDEWYTPSPAQLERQRLQELKAARRMEEEQRKALRAAQRDQLTDDAMNIAQNTLNRFKK